MKEPNFSWSCNLYDYYWRNRIESCQVCCQGGSFVLLSTEQDHQLRDSWPLDLKLQRRITRNFPYLLDMIDSSVLVKSLCSEECLNYLQKADIEEMPTNYKRNWKLLNCMLQRSVRQFKIVSKCLEKTGQRHLMELFEKDVCEFCVFFFLKVHWHFAF
jgi:hypothetical protein